MTDYDAIIVGAGPNGLAAAVTLARQGCKVLLQEAKTTIGGGARSAELTEPGFIHDVCSAIHPLGVGSPFFKELPLHEFGLEWVYPDAEFAHPLDDAPAVIVERNVNATAATLGRDAAMYRRIYGTYVRKADKIVEDFLGPLPFPPKNPIALVQFGLGALPPANLFAGALFREEAAKAVFAGAAAHSIMPLERPATAAYGLILSVMAHAVGWPMAKGGSQHIADALAAYLRSLGGEIVTNAPVTSLDALPPAKAILMDITPRQFLQIAGDSLPPFYKWRMSNYRYGAGVFKVDYALSEPIPWKDPNVARAATVHLGGTFAEIAASERTMVRGEHAEKPYVLLAQQTLFDNTRAPQGKHTAWAYCHVPGGSTKDMSAIIDAQIERFAPGFRDVVIKRHTYNTEQYQAYNSNYIGGDINGGVMDLGQLFNRPVARLNPYTTPLKNVYLCSASTPPGGGVHGMCGYWAAQAALKRSL